MSSSFQSIHENIPRLRAHARAMTRNRDQADDLVQDCLERAFAKRAQFQRGTNLPAWLFVILRNMHVNTLRKAANRLTAHGLDIENCGVAVGANQDDALVMRDLRRALAQLSPQDRTVIRLIGVEGVSYAEAAETLDIAIGTVKSRLSRARNRLRALMDGAPAVIPDMGPSV